MSRLNVIAEGVETAEQLAILRKLRCEYAQGIIGFSKPAPPTAGALLGKESKMVAVHRQNSVRAGKTGGL